LPCIMADDYTNCTDFLIAWFAGLQHGYVLGLTIFRLIYLFSCVIIVFCQFSPLSIL
jgi:hypothetical protein